MSKFEKIILSLFAVFTVVCLIGGIAVKAQTYTFNQQPSPSHKLGFGSVIFSQGTGGIALASCDGMTAVNAARACQIGMGSNNIPDTIRYRNTLLTDASNSLGIVIYGNMILKYAVWAEEFNEAGYTANAADTNSSGLNIAGGRFSESNYYGGWLVSVIDGGGDNDEHIRVADGPVSLLQIETTDAANDTVQVQLCGEPFQLESGKQMWFRTRFMVEDASADMYATGLGIRTNTDIIGQAPSDGVYFTWNTNGSFAYHLRQDGTNTTADTGIDCTDQTNVTCAFYYDGVDSVTFTASSAGSSFSTTLTDNATTILIPDDEALTAFIAVETRDTGKDWSRTDYIGVISERD